MANLVDKSGDATSNLVRGGTTSSLSFPMPGNVPLDVESVVATIDNTAGGATTPTLVVRDSSGEVVATKRMDDTIPAGGSGTATFALRLAGSGGGIRFGKINTGSFLDARTSSVGPTGDSVFIDAGNGMRLDNEAGAFNIEDFGTGLSLTSVDDVTIDAGSTHTVDIEAPGGTVHLAGGGGADLLVDSGAVTLTPSVLVTLNAGATVEVQDSLGSPIFRVNENGDLQGKTGKALTFNL